MESMQVPVEFEGESLDVGLSLGIAPSDRVVESLPLGFESLCRIADFCLYASKTSGRNQYTIFDSELNEQFVARRAILTELSEAMKWGEIEAWFQPKVSLETEAVFGFEALCRWNRGGTLVPPNEFIPVAEASGSIIELDLYMMREACRIVSAWNRSVGTEYSVSVNLSATHFRSGSIVESVARVLRDTGLTPGLLTLEITETVQLVNWDVVRDIFAQLRKLGCRISIDDFGSGYSSLAYLRAMQADELKIDRSLVQEIETSDEARHVLSSVIELAHSLNMRVIVEGVESEDQSDILSSLGCIYGQGFLFGRPMPAKSALARYAASVGLDIAS
ncbi:MAG: EAL domain-containing protein [Silicimonas sp.]|nr:EAL domain-containing protein [Silicimonas sp.]